MPQILIISILVFIAAALMAAAVFQLFRDRWDPETGRVRKQLRRLAETGGGGSIDIIRKKRKLSEIALLNAWLERIPGIYRLDLLLQQADARLPLGVFLLLSLVLAMGGFSLVSILAGGALPGLPAALFLGAAPYFYLQAKKKRRLQQFERQLPDALGMVAKALKAGHAFSAGMQMVAQEFPAPIGPEFEKTLNEINLGLGLDDALKNITERVDCTDLKFFAVSVIIQRETGGNLAEILENISHHIRERFKLRGRIQTLSAEGRLSAVILIAIPILVAIALYALNPSYLSILAEDPAGRMMTAASLFMMIAGVFIMRRMIMFKI